MVGIPTSKTYCCGGNDRGGGEQATLRNISKTEFDKAEGSGKNVNASERLR
jgi:hypothetical protein